MADRKSTSGTSKSARSKKPTSKRRKHVGDVLGLGGVQAPKGAPRATSDRSGNPKGIDLPLRRKKSASLKPARVRG